MLRGDDFLEASLETTATAGGNFANHSFTAAKNSSSVDVSKRILLEELSKRGSTNKHDSLSAGGVSPEHRSGNLKARGGVTQNCVETGGEGTELVTREEGSVVQE